MRIREVAKKGQQDFEVPKKKVNKIFSKGDTINFSQFLVCQVWHSPAQTHRSNVPSSAHQRGRASGVVDENFPYWHIHT